MGLTVKQERFVLGLFKGLSQRQAYKEAFESALKWKDGTVDNRASELAKNDEVLGRLKELQQEEAKQTLWSREKIIAEFEEIKNKCKEEETVLDRYGISTGVLKFDSNGAIKALENIGKLLGMYEEKVRHSGNVGINIIDDISGDNDG